MIFDDVLSALEAGRSPVVITERKDHLQAIAERLTKFAKNVIVLKGGMRAKQRNQATEALAVRAGRRGARHRGDRSLSR